MTTVSTLTSIIASLGIDPPTGCDTWAALERLPLLQKLKDAGLPLTQRQKVANSVGAAKREGWLNVAPDKAAPDAVRVPAAPLQAEVADVSDSGTQKSASAVARCVVVDAFRDVRVFVLSDAHTDYTANLDWLKSHLPMRAEGAFDVCLCAGDVSDNLEVLSAALTVLATRFDEVVFTSGNHDVWCRPPPIPTNKPDGRTSLGRLEEVHKLCAKLRVHTTPLWLVGSGGARDVLIVPLASWYHASFGTAVAIRRRATGLAQRLGTTRRPSLASRPTADCEPDLPDVDAGENAEANFMGAWSDFHMCKWPSHLNKGSALAQHFAEMNEVWLKELVAYLPAPPPAGRPPPPRALTKVETYALYGQQPHGGTAPQPTWTSVDPDTFFTRRTSPRATHDAALLAASGVAGGGGGERPFIVSLSHMVPRQELVPEKRMLMQPSLHTTCGSAFLEAQIRRLMPDVHAFGHTHLNMDLTLDGIRYVQHPLGTPREQRAQTRVSSFGLMRVYDASAGGETAQHWTHWGRHYEEFERDLTHTERPPYVKKVMGGDLSVRLKNS